ncbi:MAG: hypothetical protein R3B71_02510 [Candidatus Gracilibacteria bacterium]
MKDRIRCNAPRKIIQCYAMSHHERDKSPRVGIFLYSTVGKLAVMLRASEEVCDEIRLNNSLWWPSAVPESLTDQSWFLLSRDTGLIEGVKLFPPPSPLLVEWKDRPRRRALARITLETRKRVAEQCAEIAKEEEAKLQLVREFTAADVEAALELWRKTQTHSTSNNLVKKKIR